MATEYTRRWETRRGGARRDAARADESARPKEPPGYYGLPVIHGPHWNWLIVAYFFFGGLAGASYAVASIAAIVGGAGNRRIARAGRYLALAATLPCPPLLILDLGRPERFFHMLRVLKVRSPMSVGTWTLLVFSGFAGLSALAQAAEDGLLGRDTPLARAGRALPARAIGGAGLLPAFFLSGYTGTLLGATAVPLWARNALLLGPLFLASSVSNACAALTLILVARPGEGREAGERLAGLETIAQVAELALLLATEARLGPAIRRPLATGRLAPVYRAGVLGAGIAAPLALRLLGRVAPRRDAPLTTAVSAALTLTGGLLFRYVILYAGRASADDPAATFALTRGERAD
jgi:formate-dependent nitrite reductase membrane component NrfD